MLNITDYMNVWNDRSCSICLYNRQKDLSSDRFKLFLCVWLIHICRSINSDNVSSHSLKDFWRKNVGSRTLNFCTTVMKFWNNLVSSITESRDNSSKNFFFGGRLSTNISGPTHFSESSMSSVHTDTWILLDN